ncbi:MAG TPA: hypothetical protein VGK89_12250 [Candidatus Eisenbacteria bacterium]|jgi:hypothetical protein
MRAPRALLPFLLLAAPWPSALSPPRFTREQMEAALPAESRALIVYGTRDQAAVTLLRARALALAGRFAGGDSAAARADRDATPQELGDRMLVLLGGPAENEWTRRLAPGLPLEFTPRGFRWFGRDYERPGDAIHLVYPSPLEPRRFLLLVAGNSPAALSDRGGGLGFGLDDWRIYRDGVLARRGRFAQSPSRPWRYDTALDRDLERERERFVEALRTRRGRGLAVRAPADLACEGAAAAAESLLVRLDRMGLGAPASAPATLTLYHTLEEKGTLTRDTRPEHLDLGGAHAALPAGRSALDLWSVAALRLRAAGAPAAAPYLRPAAVWLAGAFEGEPLARAVSRLYFGGLLPTARAAASRESEFRSPLQWIPARALLARALWESAGARRVAALRSLLAASPPSDLDSLCAAAGTRAAAVEKRYAALADSLARASPASLAAVRPRAWRPDQGFQRGVCLAHAVGLERGYLSAACARELARLRALGAEWVSLTPFGFLPSPATPEVFPSNEGGPDGESDEAVAEAGARARALGMRVWLAPHLWTRGWTGDLDFGPAGWPRFFERYRAFLLHYALLAEREGMDGLVVGHELAGASLGHPDRWRTLIAEVRRVYSGTLAYDANWGEELEGIRFWDALDVVGVSFYAPLAKAPTQDVAALESGAAKALRALRAVAARTRRPVLLAEVGYAPSPEAPVRPWEEPGGLPDLETQRACYEAVVRALEPCDWVAGALWWKWFSSDDRGGERDASFTPRGKPAERVLERALREWEERPVRVPER